MSITSLFAKANEDVFFITRYSLAITVASVMVLIREKLVKR